MTEGSPLNKIILFAFPMLIGNIAQQLYSTVDSIVVGKYVGDNALAAVGSSAPVYNLLLVLFIGVSTGSSIMVSQYFGAKDKESLAKSIGNSLSLTAVVSLVIMALSLVVVDPMLHMLGTPDSIFDWCHDY
ncbi:MAG: oligosaccharide flippase family protein, partial [Oscillospiraceae bacterium]|nr:oligosaccharide flippase family protein [Oscillospiraceae bacterium]